jgi:hypothetical protein
MKSRREYQFRIAEEIEKAVRTLDTNSCIGLQVAQTEILLDIRDVLVELSKSEKPDEH